MRSRLKVCNIHGYYDAVVNEVCPACKAEQQLASARREGWEQCQKESQLAILDHFTCCDFKRGCDHDWCNMLKEIADAIAAMEYKGESK